MRGSEGKVRGSEGMFLMWFDGWMQENTNKRGKRGKKRSREERGKGREKERERERGKK